MNLQIHFASPASSSPPAFALRLTLSHAMQVFTRGPMDSSWKEFSKKMHLLKATLPPLGLSFCDPSPPPSWPFLSVSLSVMKAESNYEE